MPVIGIVGGVGSGKSTAAEAFVELGCARIDADALGHAVLREPDVKAAIVKQWGGAVLDAAGEVDRAALGRRVFADPAELERLNAIVHPRMGERIAAEIETIRRRNAAVGVVLDAAVLFEAGWDTLCTHVVFVDAPACVRRRRVEAARGWDAASWRRREKSQIPLDSKRRRCYASIDNSSSASCLRKQVRELFHRMVQEADAPQ
jgi:dephospho-CoA kinase